MAKSKSTKNTSKSIEDIKTKEIETYKSARDAVKLIRDTFEEKEAMLLGKTLDSTVKSTKSRVYDPRLSTIAFERMSRVMAQIPTGTIRALTAQDKGKTAFMNLIHTKYILPNANTQYDILTKFKLLDIYSLVYGSMFALVDYVVTDSYQGPDFHIIPIRNVVPQQGKYTLNDCDYVFVKSNVTKKWLLSRDTKNWKNIDKLIEASKGGTSKDFDDQTYTEKKQGDEASGALSKMKDNYDIITKYERDRWLTFEEKTGIILRDCENPHKNGKLPVVGKHAFPLLDRFYGLGEFERGRSLQNAINSLINLYLDGIKMSLFPPMKVYLPDILGSSLKQEPGAFWILKNNNPNAISQMAISPQGISTFQSTYQFMVASLFNQSGSSNTSITKDTDPTQGKTPQALKMQAARESARDNFDRFMMEKTIEEIFDRFADLMATKQEKPIKLNLMAKELQDIAQQYPDAVEMFESNEMGAVTIKPQEIKGATYKFYIDPGTTLKRDEQSENEVSTQLMTFIAQMPGAAEQIAKDGKVRLGNKVIDFGELMKRSVITSGLQDSEKIITDMTPEDMAKANFEQQQLQGMMGGQGMPQGGQSQMPQGAPQQIPQQMPQDMGMQPPQQYGFEDPNSLAVMQELENYVRAGSQ